MLLEHSSWSEVICRSIRFYWTSEFQDLLSGPIQSPSPVQTNPKVKQSKGFGLSTNTKNKWATTPHITFNHEGGKNLFGKKSNKD